MGFLTFTAVRDYSHFGSARYLLLLLIAESVNSEENFGRCSVRTLAERARLDVRNTHRYINDLIADGELIVVETAGKANHYYVPIYEGEPGYDPQPCDGVGHACNGYHTSLEVNRDALNFRRGTKSRSGNHTRRRDGNITSTGNPTRGGMVTLPGGDGKITRGGVVTLPPDPYMIPLLSQDDPNAHARATPLNGNLALAEPEPDHSPPAPPSPGPEARRIWHDMRAAMVPKVGQAVVTSWGTQCHLYDAGPDQWQLRLGPGIPIDMFKARFEALLTDELCRQMQAGNQLLQIVRSG